jgi:glycosyltransferase involved in cell wall biosynthesis
MDISIIIPVYNEARALPELYQILTDALEELPKTAEMVFVDDGSRDGSGAVLDELAQSDERVQVLHLRRNYGQTAAIMAGFQHCTGDIIIPMDGDGQNDPPIFLASWTSFPKGSMLYPVGASTGTINYRVDCLRWWRTG